MVDETIEDIQKLSPSKRIEKLKALEQKKKAEIERAQTLIKESERQIAIEEKLSDMRIPDAETVDIGGLFKKGEQLEHTVAREHTQIPEEVLREQQEYLRQLPAQQIEQRAAYLQTQVERSGYMTADQQTQMAALYAEVRHRQEGIRSGSYVSATNTIEHTLSMTKRILGDLYRR